MSAQLIELQFRPTLDLLTPTRSFVTELLKSRRVEEDVVYRVVVAMHELLENVMKYSVDGVAHLSAGVAVAESDDNLVFCLRVSNECEPARLSNLRGEFESMKESEDPIAYYTALMLKNAGRAKLSGVGLARIWAEAQMDLDCEIAGSKATIVARTSIALPTSTP
jgi:hypothetical protein